MDPADQEDWSQENAHSFFYANQDRLAGNLGPGTVFSRDGNVARISPFIILPGRGMEARVAVSLYWRCLGIQACN